MAQSVPTATWVPCLRTAPCRWAGTFHHLDARNSVARFWLDSDRDGEQRDRGPARAVLRHGGSDRDPQRPGGHATGCERVTMTTPTFEGKRYYVFDGGCITFVFTLDGDSDSRGEPLALATQAVGAVSRADLRRQVHDESDGRLSLDPAAAEDG